MLPEQVVQVADKLQQLAQRTWRVWLKLEDGSVYTREKATMHEGQLGISGSNGADLLMNASIGDEMQCTGDAQYWR